MEKAVGVLECEISALKTQREELQATLDTFASSQPGVDAKVRFGQTDLFLFCGV